MSIKNSISGSIEYLSLLKNKFRKFYLNSNLYDKKISSKLEKGLEYKPSLSILSCLVRYDKKKNNIEDFNVNSIWDIKRENKKLNNFYWLFSIDLKSSKKITHSIIENWIDKNNKYSSQFWEIDTLSKRVISWIANYKLTYEEGNLDYKKKFNKLIFKQINHLINETKKSDDVFNKLLGCVAIILTGLSYKHHNYSDFGLNLLNRIISTSFDKKYFPKTRSIRQLIFYLKYFILIRELLKESLNEIPEYLDEIIFYLGRAYNFICGSTKVNFLFNGNQNDNLDEFDKYLEINKYKFKHNSNEIGGYSILKDKNLIIAMDTGSAPEKKFSKEYQCGPLSIEIFYRGKKLITNCGYFENNNQKLNLISRTTAAQSTFILDDKSICLIKKNFDGLNLVERGFSTFDKNIVFEKNLWIIKSSHDSYLKEYGTIHQRTLEYFPENNKIVGKDRLIKKNNFISKKFEIRFHLMPNTKVTKLQDNTVILIELENSGWRFQSKSGPIDVETGLYFYNKNSFNENQNIFISGTTVKEDQEIKWEITKI